MKKYDRLACAPAAGMLALGSNEQAEMLEDEAESHWEIVESHRFKLTTAVDPVKLTPYLRQCRVIDVQDEDEVLNSLILSTRSRRAGQCLFLKKKQFL